MFFGDSASRFAIDRAVEDKTSFYQKSSYSMTPNKHAHRQSCFLTFRILKILDIGKFRLCAWMGSPNTLGEALWNKRSSPFVFGVSGSHAIARERAVSVSRP
jgi:hypothetical protein